MKNIPLLVGTIVGTVALIALIAVVFSKADQPKIIDSSIIVHDAKDVKGPDNAKVTVVEFSDFECPICHDTEPLVQQLLTKHANDVRFVYRNFPLQEVHPHAQQSAQAGEAAAEVGKFWEMHDLLFQNQDEWAKLDTADAVQKKFDEYAAKLQIDKNDFEKRIVSKEVSDRVTEDVSDGTKAGIQGTPTFFVNGKEVLAPQLISTVESLLSSPSSK